MNAPTFSEDDNFLKIALCDSAHINWRLWLLNQCTLGQLYCLSYDWIIFGPFNIWAGLELIDRKLKARSEWSVQKLVLVAYCSPAWQTKLTKWTDSCLTCLGGLGRCQWPVSKSVQIKASVSKFGSDLKMIRPILTWPMNTHTENGWCPRTRNTKPTAMDHASSHQTTTCGMILYLPLVFPEDLSQALLRPCE